MTLINEKQQQDWGMLYYFSASNKFKYTKL